MNPNNVLCLRPYWLANASQLAKLYRLVLPITRRHGSRRKHRSSLLYFNCCFLEICCLATGVAYRVSTEQRVYMLQYIALHYMCDISAAILYTDM
jgi:hypothetical protein